MILHNWLKMTFWPPTSKKCFLSKLSIWVLQQMVSLKRFLTSQIHKSSFRSRIWQDVEFYIPFFNNVLYVGTVFLVENVGKLIIIQKILSLLSQSLIFLIMVHIVNFWYDDYWECWHFSVLNSTWKLFQLCYVIYQKS